MRGHGMLIPSTKDQQTGTGPRTASDGAHPWCKCAQRASDHDMSLRTALELSLPSEAIVRDGGNLGVQQHHALERDAQLRGLSKVLELEAPLRAAATR